MQPSTRKSWQLAAKTAFVVIVTALAWANVTVAVIAICATVLAALHGKANEVIEFSFGPLKAKLREEISEAEKLVRKLREFAALQAKVIIAAGVRTGRFGDEGDWLYRHVTAMESSLRDMGVSDEQMADARHEMLRYVISDLGSQAMGHGMVPTKAGKDAVADWQSVMGKGLAKSPDEIQAFLLKWNLMNPERAQRIEDMRWIAQNGRIRDHDQYRRSQIAVGWE